LQHIAPALERRLRDSTLAGYSGRLGLNFYRAGVSLTFEGGKITSIEPWQPSPEDAGDVRFPDLTFYHLLCGRKSFTELYDFFADCFARNDEARALVEALFPKKPADVWGIV
jgi:hypothetical protein